MTSLYLKSAVIEKFTTENQTLHKKALVNIHILMLQDIQFIHELVTACH